MVISNSQAEHFRVRYNDIFFSEMKEYIRINFPEVYSNIDSPGVEAIIRFSVTKANKFGFDTERLIYHFLSLVLTLGPNFEKEHKWITPIVYDVDNDPGSRMDEMISLTKTYLESVSNAS